MSGPEAFFGTETKAGIDLAVDEANKDGGPQGRRVELFSADDQSTPQETVNQVLSLIDRERVVALLGEVASVRSRVGGVVANRKHVPMISPGSTHPDLTKVGPFVFRTCFDDVFQGRAAARFLVGVQGRKRIAVLFQSDDLYSSGLVHTFRDEAQKLGVTVMAPQGFLESETDIAPYLRQIAQQKPDVVYAPIFYPVMIRIARQASAMGLPGRIFFGGDAWDSDEILRAASAEMEGAMFTNHWAPDVPWARARTFVATYEQHYHHEPSSLVATGYDAALVLVDALKRAQGDTPEAIRDAIQATTNFQGAAGAITIDADRTTYKSVLIVEIAHGKFSYKASVDVPRPAAAGAPP